MKNGLSYLPLERNRNKAISNGNAKWSERHGLKKIGKTYWDAVKIIQKDDSVFIDTNDFTFTQAVRNKEGQNTARIIFVKFSLMSQMKMTW